MDSRELIGGEHSLLSYGPYDNFLNLTFAQRPLHPVPQAAKKIMCEKKHRKVDRAVFDVFIPNYIAAMKSTSPLSQSRSGVVLFNEGINNLIQKP